MKSNLKSNYRRPQAKILSQRLKEPRQFIQVIAGPRQTGKTTLVQQVAETLLAPVRFSSADEPALKDTNWIEQQWELARLEAKGGEAILVLDEIQKIPGWSETVKRLWDEDSRTSKDIKVVVLGSAPLLIQQGLSESLAGRFEVIRLPHWSALEMKAAFGWSIEKSIYYGGYPGAARLTAEPQRWKRYILDALIETTISRDVLLMTRVDKPALLRRLFELACRYSGQILSYTKMVGQLQDAGNTVTLAHYLDLLGGAGMVTGLSKFAGERVRQRGSSPKLQVFNTALLSAQTENTFEQARRDPEYWGRLVESAVGAHLVNGAAIHDYELFYWRERNREVDFVVRKGQQLIAIEVKSGKGPTGALPGMDAFKEAFRPQQLLLVGGDGIPVNDFLSRTVGEWIGGSM